MSSNSFYNSLSHNHRLTNHRPNRRSYGHQPWRNNQANAFEKRSENLNSFGKTVWSILESDEQIKSIKSEDDQRNELGACPICLEEFNSTQDKRTDDLRLVKTNPCKHSYHYRCLLMLVANDSRCAICRLEINNNSIIYKL